MIPLSLGQVAMAVGADAVAHPELSIAAVSTDSRALVPGSLFVALRGEERDGHDWVEDAVAAGAAAVLVDRDVEVRGDVGVLRVPDTWAAMLALGAHVRSVVDPPTVAVTGSVGKTTTKDLVAAALSGTLRTVAASGSFNNELGVPLTLLGVEADTEALVVEIGARRPGDIAHLGAAVAPDVAIVTAVAPVHLELFGSIDAITRTKAELVGALDATGTAVLNADGRGVDVVTYGESP
ncbi:MAG: Mur ligase family protein, partial [Nitriliruptorales bacterium]|nr:Mur ligase family protein [Nitriliruptorales bacterium]